MAEDMSHFFVWRWSNSFCISVLVVYSVNCYILLTLATKRCTHVSVQIISN